MCTGVWDIFMSDLRDWLRQINLDQYADVLEANDIDLDVLGDLDDTDLSQLGLSLGNRRRLMKAVAARPGDRMLTLSPGFDAPAQPLPPAGSLPVPKEPESRDDCERHGFRPPSPILLGARGGGIARCRSTVGRACSPGPRDCRHRRSWNRYVFARNLSFAGRMLVGA